MGRKSEKKKMDGNEEKGMKKEKWKGPRFLYEAI